MFLKQRVACGTFFSYFVPAYLKPKLKGLLCGNTFVYLWFRDSRRSDSELPQRWSNYHRLGSCIRCYYDWHGGNHHIQ